MLTHESGQGGYDYYADDPYGYDDDYDDPDGRGDRDEDGFHDEGYDDGYRDLDDDDLSDPEDEMKAKKARRKKIWRRIRRTCYVAAALMIVGTATAFGIGYSVWNVTPPEVIAKSTNQTIVLKYPDGKEFNRIVPPNGENRLMVKDVRKEGSPEVSKAIVDATLAAEDATFWSNWGFDPMGILGAAFKQLTGGSGGGSTLTQQYIKLSTGADQATYMRKFKEVVLSFKMTQTQEKDDILKAYLNTAYYGRGAYGIHSAAEAYFGKKPSEINESEAAVLAGMVQRPTQNDPSYNPEQGLKRWTYVANEMAKNGFVTPQKRAEMGMPVTRGRDDWRGEGLTGSQYHIQQRVLDELERKGNGENVLARNGYQVVVNIDPAAQRAAEAAVDKITGNQPQNLKTSLVAVDPKTGAVQAYYGGGSKAGGFDYANAPQEPGSSFKPFTVMAGLQQGKGLGEVYDGSSPQPIAGTTFANSRGSACKDPKRCGVREAMNESVNTVFVNMAVKVGPDKVQKAAYQAGIPQEIDGKPTLRNSKGNPEAGIALGQYPVRTTDMAGAYSAFANGGNRVQPRFVAQITDSNGKVLRDFNEEAEAQQKPAFDSDAEKSKNLAANLTESLKGVAAASKRELAGKRPVAAKTGTHQYFDTDDNSKAWMVGYTPQISAAVSLGSSDSKPVKDASGKAIYGSGLPGAVWQEFMNSYHQGKPVEKFPKPKPIGVFEVPPPPPPPTPPPPPPGPTITTPLLPTPSWPGSSGSGEPSETQSREPTSGAYPSEECGGFFGPPCPGEGGGDYGGRNPHSDGGPNAAAPTRRPGG